MADYFGDVFHTFLGLDSVIYLAFMGQSPASWFSSKYLELCFKYKQALMGLERNGGKLLMTTFSFWGGVNL